ncbi:hypothetical protein H696_01193 [Fonticula alba]|uniref:Uncharacterized protein n=1 Tax=Fonticula alba TaxID=691883 RepID=A0A058ZBH5_FONAL|nr:hypothetical protein H696_01193 [Fonticula alba]KCV71775.1 hypothetical protein H696_01193 [Fonticula alba]|eukprot:XP_009493353.1 hypothetical protein H696_01193 [Fonticula alba]
MADAHQALADALDQCPGLEPSVRRHLHEAFIPDALLGAGLLPLVDLADRLTTCTLAADRLAPGLIRRMAPPGSAGSPPDSPAPQQVPQPLGATTTDHLVASILGLLALPIDPSLLLLPGLPLAEHAPPARAGVLGGLPPCRLPAVGGLPLDEHCLELGLSAAACEELGLGPVAEHAALSPAPGVAEATTTDLLAGLGHLLERMHLLELVLRRVLAEAECPVLGRAPRPGPPTTGLQHVRNAYASLAAERLRANASPGAPSSLQLQNIGDFTRLALHHAMESAANAVCGPASSAPGSGLIHQARCRGYLRVVSAHMVTAPPLGRQAPDPLAGNISTSFLQSNAWLQVVDHSDPALLMTSSLLGDVEAAIDHWLSGEVGVPQTSATSTSSSAITLVAESIADAFDLDVLLIVRPHWSLSNGLPWRVPLSRSMLAIGPLYPGHLDRFSWMELSVGGEPTAGPRRDVDESPIDATASDYLLDLDHGRGSVDLVVSLREPVSQIWEVAAEQGGPFAARGIPFGPQTGVCAVGLCKIAG